MVCDGINYNFSDVMCVRGVIVCEMNYVWVGSGLGHVVVSIEKSLVCVQCTC
jgi:hypothetical protein